MILFSLHIQIKEKLNFYVELGIFSIVRNREAPSLSGTGKILSYWELLDSFPIGNWQDPFVLRTGQLLSNCEMRHSIRNESEPHKLKKAAKKSKKC